MLCKPPSRITGTIYKSCHQSKYLNVTEEKFSNTKCRCWSANLTWTSQSKWATRVAGWTGWPPRRCSSTCTPPPPRPASLQNRFLSLALATVYLSRGFMPGAEPVQNMCLHLPLSRQVLPGRHQGSLLWEPWNWHLHLCPGPCQRICKLTLSNLISKSDKMQHSSSMIISGRKTSNLERDGKLKDEHRAWGAEKPFLAFHWDHSDAGEEWRLDRPRHIAHGHRQPPWGLRALQTDLCQVIPRVWIAVWFLVSRLFIYLQPRPLSSSNLGDFWTSD